jgi:hypothetical protein
MMAVTGFVITSLSNIRQDLMGFRDEFKLQCFVAIAIIAVRCGVAPSSEDALISLTGTARATCNNAKKSPCRCGVADAILFLYCCWCLNSIVTAVADYSVAFCCVCPALFYLSIVMIAPW